MMKDDVISPVWLSTSVLMAIVQVNLPSFTIGLLFEDMISSKRIYRSRTNGEGSQGATG